MNKIRVAGDETMEYKDGKTMIHRVFLSDVDKIFSDINRRFQK